MCLFRFLWVNMSKRKLEAVGTQYGNFTILDSEPIDAGRHRLKYLVKCVCGNTKHVLIDNLRSGKSTNCGCIRQQKSIDVCRKHGMSDSRVYAVWLQMKARCTLPNHKQYRDYGARGITVCPRWLESFENFMEDMGLPKKGQSLDRIDNDGPYTKDNCRWADRTTQNRNKRNNRYFEFEGRSMLLSEWSEELGINLKTLASRIYLYKWSVEDAFSLPVGELSVTIQKSDHS